MVTQTAPAKRRLLFDHDDEAIVAEVGITFSDSARFWYAAASSEPASVLARELVPCEGPAHRCVVGYVELARDALVACADRPPGRRAASSRMRVIQHSRRLVWDADGRPLTTRKQQAHFPRLDQSFQTLELILEGRCPMPGCERPPSRDARVQRRRLARRVCCLAVVPNDVRQSRRGRLVAEGAVWSSEVVALEVEG